MATTQSSNGLQNKILTVTSGEPMRMGALFTCFSCRSSYFGHIPPPTAKVRSLCLSSGSLGCCFWICLSYWPIFVIRSAWDRHQPCVMAESFTCWLQTCSGAVWELSLLQPQDLLWHMSYHSWVPFGHGSRQKGRNYALPTTGIARESNSSAAQSLTTAVLHQPIS